MVFVVLALSAHTAVLVERKRQEQKLRSQIAEETMSVVSRLEVELNADVFLANGLAAMVIAVKNPADQEIQDALKSLYKLGRHLRNIGLAPGNRISHLYPLEGNQAAIGLYYPDVAEQWPAVKKAIDQRTSMLAGPVKLRQGSTGLINRTPVFLEDGSYWGLLSLVLDTESLFHAAGLVTEASGTYFALRGKDALGGRGTPFFGAPSLFTTDSIVHSVMVPGGSWEIAAYPKGGWQREQQNLNVMEVFLVAASLAVALVAYAYQRGRMRIVANERRLRILLETTHDGVIVINEWGLIEEFNPAAEAMFGYSSSEVLGRSVNCLMHEQDASKHNEYVANPSRASVRIMGKGRCITGRRKDGSDFPIEVTVGEAKIDGNRVHVGVLRDITEQKAFEEKLLELATTDALTGVDNRRAVLDKLQSAFLMSQRYGHSLSILMIDVDYFKRINDTFGHGIGDQALLHITAVAKKCLRSTDTLGRFGGEEFIVLLPETALEQAVLVAEKMLAAISASSLTVSREEKINMTVSVGIATTTLEIPSSEVLVSLADQALYTAKAAGRNCYRCSPKFNVTTENPPLTPASF